MWPSCQRNSVVRRNSAGPQLPAHDVAPLVQQQGQVAVALDPLGHVLAEDRLAGGAHDDGLVQLLAAAVGDDGQLGAEALDVLGLPGQVALGDEEREVDVLGARRLDAAVDLGLHPLPQRAGVGPDDHRCPAAGPLSASSALATTSWYQRGKSSAWGVRTGALAMARG